MPYSKLTIIIPAFNESRRLIETVFKLDSYLKRYTHDTEIIIVNDGSNNDFFETHKDELKKCASVVSYPKNKGKGFAVYTGITLSSVESEYVLFMDADGSTELSYIDIFLQQAKENDIVIASRHPWGENIKSCQPFVRKKLGTIGRKFIKYILPTIEDTQCGFKMFKRQIAQNIASKQTIWRWAFDIEYLVIAKENCLKIKEVSVEWSDNKESKVKVISASIYTVWEILKIILNKKRRKYRF